MACTGGCTVDIALLNQGGQERCTVSNNLLVYAPMAAFCAYPGPNDSNNQAPTNDIVWTDNVFQRGANGKCATYGPIYGWYPNLGTGNVWNGNRWDDGTPLDP